MFKIIGSTIDLRSNATVIYCQCSIREYLEIVGDNFGDFYIQRKRESHKAYKRLKKDIEEGALLPAITLSAKHHLVDTIKSKTGSSEELFNKIRDGSSLDILDGLQRTYIIKDIVTEGRPLMEGQQLLLEIWLESELTKIIYRMIVLNSGQKAMSLRHQIELLFMSLEGTISESIKGIEIFKERDLKRRTSANKYSLYTIVSAYQAFISGSHETSKDNMVAQKLVEENTLDASEEELSIKFNNFVHYLNKFKELDEVMWDHYSKLTLDKLNDDFVTQCIERLQKTKDDKVTPEQVLNTLRESCTWLASENVMLGLFSAINNFIESGKQDRVDKAFDYLKFNGVHIPDPIGLITFSQIRAAENPRKSNIGFATRKMIYNGFREFFRDEGETPLDKCWSDVAE